LKDSHAKGAVKIRLQEPVAKPSEDQDEHQRFRGELAPKIDTACGESELDHGRLLGKASVVVDTTIAGTS